MKIDFHTHGKLAKKLPFSRIYTDWLFGEAKQAGLDAICLTEHFNTLGFDQVYGYIAENFQRDGDTFLAEGLWIFPGMETDIAEGGHVLTVGKMEDILELNRRLEPYKEKGSFLPFRELLGLLREYPVMIGAGHPYREGGHIPELSRELLEQFDFLDLNGKDLALDKEETERLVYGLGQELGIPVVSGSDTHQAFQYGCVCTRFARSISTVEGLKQAIADGRYEIQISGNISFQVKTAGILKAALKEIHNLGGDYVSVLTRYCPFN